MRTIRNPGFALILAGLALAPPAEARNRVPKPPVSRAPRPAKPPSPAGRPKKLGKPPPPREAPPEFPAGADESPACRAAELERTACLDELAQRGIRFNKVARAAGVAAPVRLEGPVAGVVYRTDYPDRERPTVPFEVFDCRLVVALAELGPILRKHDIDEVRIFSAWRPPPRSFPEGKVADRHPGGLAADLRLFKKSNGDSLEVEKDFNGEVGGDPCGANAVPPSRATPAALELREILCAAAEARLFHVLLSPNFDGAHRNHFHVEVRPGVRWFIVR